MQGSPRSEQGWAFRPRWPRVLCWIRRRHSSRASPASRTTWKGSMTATASGNSSVVAVLNPVNPSIATMSIPWRQVWSRSASHCLNTCLDRPSTMSSSRAGPVPARTGVRSMITVTYLSPRRVCRHTCSSTPITFTPVEPAGIGDQHAAALGQHRAVRRVPRDTKSLCDSGDREVLTHDALQRPSQCPTGEPGPRLRCPAGVLPPHMPAPVAAVPADRDQQDRRAPPQRFVRQPPHRGVPRTARPAASSAPLISVHDPALQHRPVRFQELSHDPQAQPVQPGERGHIGVSESRVGHVEVFQMGSVRTSIFGGPRPLSGQRRARTSYTLNCEEPVWLDGRTNR